MSKPPTKEIVKPASRSVQRKLPGLVGSILVAVLVLVALFANLLAPYGAKQPVGVPYQASSADHWLGTDNFGHDVLSRVVFGARLSLAAGVVSIALALLLGASLGALSGYLGGWFDLLAMRAIDVLLSFPAILVALLIVVALSPSTTAVIVAVATINVPLFCRQARAVVLTTKHQDYVLASVAAGAGLGHLLFRVLMPALIGPMVVLSTLGLGTAILEVAGLSFLGVGGEPDAAEWGVMLRSAKDALNRAPVVTWLAPGLAITASVVGFGLLGDAIRDFCEPSTR
jgi:peptide/nickel transport system permease protein